MHEFPGQRTTDAGMTPRPILMTMEGAVAAPGPLVIDSVNAYDGANTGRTDEIRSGWLMAQVTASGKWVPVKRTRVTNTGTLTALVVDNAAAFQVGETISVGADTGIVITAINYTTNTLTIASTAVIAGEAVVCTTFKDGTTSAAGSETCRMVMRESVRMLSGVAYETTRVDKAIELFVGGYFIAANILGDLAAVRADTAAKIGLMAWSDTQQTA